MHLFWEHIHMIKQRNLLFLAMILSLALVACGSSASEDNDAVLETAQSIAGTMVAVQFTELAQVNPTATEAALEASATPGEAKDTPTAVAGGGECLSASLSDESIPDDTIFAPGESFQKSWVLTNTGTCTWTEEYALAFHHGNAMTADEFTPLAGWVLPGESVVLALNMVAPFQPGSHIGFWSLQSPNGTYFGASSTDTFWVKITIPGATPTSKPRDLAWSSGGAVRNDGLVSNDIEVGDDNTNGDWHGFATFNFGNLTNDSTVTAVILYLNSNNSVSGDPFTELGCLNVYASSYGGLDTSDYGNADGVPLWTFCSVAELSGGAIYGGPAAISAVQNALNANQLQLSFQFDNQTNSSGSNDNIKLNPNLSLFWYRID
jgi:hypothetical protein